mmetsp:Transcript_2482/g.6272  ORF Transcript_2482/g.6272 Transcript_2482/m.6272 type:complete len:264 (+) Transcript_2482:22-813(+)
MKYCYNFCHLHLHICDPNLVPWGGSLSVVGPSPTAVASVATASSSSVAAAAAIVAAAAAAAVSSVAAPVSATSSIPSVAASVSATSAVAASAVAASATATIAAVSPAAAGTSGLRGSDRDAPAPLLLVVEVRDRVLSALLRLERHEAESPRALGVVSLEGHPRAHHTVLGEPLSQVVVSDLPRQAANERLDLLGRRGIVGDRQGLLRRLVSSWGGGLRGGLVSSRRDLRGHFWSSLLVTHTLCGCYGCFASFACSVHTVARRL